MRADLLTKERVDRSAPTSVQYKMQRGSLTALLITASLTFHYRDKISVKLRSPGGNITVVDRVSALRLAILTDLKQGMPTTGTPNYLGNADGTNTDQVGGFTSTNQGVRYFMNAIHLPLGHLTLDGAEELEITIEFAAEGPTLVPTSPGEPDKSVPPPVGVCKISAIEGKTRIDTLLTYDESTDLECWQHDVREVFAVGVNNQSFFDDNGAGLQGLPLYGVPVPKDITIKITCDGEDTETDIEVYGALTAITGQLGMQPSSLIRVYQDLEAAPSSIFIKAFGDDAKKFCEFLYIRERPVPHMVSASIVAAADKEIKRVENFEARNPEAARALQQAGALAPSEVLAAKKAEFVPAVAAPSGK